MTFQLDTSGRVPKPSTDDGDLDEGVWFWSDLSPFTQGYVEALFDAEAERLNEARIAARLPLRRVAFRDLAPETLARIIADCEAATDSWLDTKSESEGRWFYARRQSGDLARFPPLTVQFGDDGKVRFA